MTHPSSRKSVTVHKRKLTALYNLAPKRTARVTAPRTRADCIDAPRPCPYVGCRHHLYLDIRPQGSLHLCQGDDVDVISAMPQTCSLDVADAGGQSFIHIAQCLNITKTHARDFCLSILGRLRAEGCLDEYQNMMGL